jgi:acyl-CoA synthetase (AMP-forming)/AMP-acid ligase II
VDETGADVPRGSTGEIVVEGESVAAGYWEDAEATSETFRGGALYTGDIGRMDEEGFVFIEDRRKDFLKVGGVRTGSHSIEETLREVDGVDDAAVIGVPHELLGEAPVAFVVPHGSQADLAARLGMHCRAKLGEDLTPIRFLFVTALPRTRTGKLSRPDLRRLLEEGA